MAKLWLKTLSEIGEARFEAALLQVLEESTHRPDIAEIRRAAGVNRGIVDPVAEEAKRHLAHLLIGMRGPHGPTLAPLRGRFLYGTQDDPKDAEGNRVVPSEAPRAEDMQFPVSDRVREVLTRLGWGSYAAGLEFIAEHPAVNRKQTEGYEINRVRQADEIFRRFTEALREVQ